MAQQHKELLALLPAGSTFVRHANHGDLYRLPNGEQIMMPRHASNNPLALSSFRNRLRRAMKGQP